MSQAASFVNGQAARAVIGQNAFPDGYAPQVAARNLLGGASGLAFSNGLLFVADDNRLGAIPQNDRVMIFDTTQIAGLHDDLTNVTTPSNRCHLCGYAAVGLIGQSDYGVTATGRNNLPTSTVGSMNHPVAVATDGHYFAVADADNNRVLLWNSVPTSQNVAPNVVLGQANFTAFQSPQVVNANSLRGPQGVWIQNGKLFVADTGNYRVLVWNSIPTQNNQPADFALGQPNLVSAIHPPQDATNPATTASQLSNPASVSSDGTHLFVADLGNNRVLIWNSIPTNNGQAADVVLGQPSMTTSVPNNSTVCSSTRLDLNGVGLPCEGTLNFPRFVLAAGGKLFVADSGNDRVLIFNSIPTVNGLFADGVLGQPDFLNDIVTNVSASIASTTIDNTASVDTVQSPSSLAFDGTNLYVADPFNDRVMVFTPADTALPDNSIVNWASEIIRQEGSVVITGTPVANDTATVTIAGTNYVYTVKANDTVEQVSQGLVNLINAGTGDPNVAAIDAGSGTLYLSSKNYNLAFDAISLTAATSNTANETATASGAYLTAGTAATGAPGMLIEINAASGTSLSDSSASSPMPQSPASLPTSLAGVQVNVDGIPAPILSVSPSQIIAQMPFSVFDRSSVSVYVRSQRNDGSVTATNASPVYIAPANPGLFNAQSFAGQVRPWPALGALHQLGNPSATVSIDGSIKAGDIVTITISGTAYAYTVVAADTLITVTQNLVNKINSAPDSNVTASAGGAFTRVVLTARQPNAAGTGIAVTGTVNTGASITATAYTSATCCNVPQGQPISAVSPAQLNETIVLLAAGLGDVNDPANNGIGITSGSSYTGPAVNSATQSVSATMNGVTAQIVSAGLPQYSYGIYYVQMIVPSSLTTNAATPVYIAQNAYISNTVTIPVSSATQVVTPAPPSTGPSSSLPPAVQGAAHILVSPANLVFAIQNYFNLNLGAQTVTIQNPAPGGALPISGLTISGPNASDFQLTQNCPAALAPLASCTASISYKPQGSGIRSANLVISSGTTTSPQIVPLSGTTTQGFEIVNQLTGKAIDIANGNAANFVPATQAEISNQASQKWTLIQIANNQYYIYNTATGKVLDVQGSSTDPFALVWQYDPANTPNQMWSLTPVDNGYFVITNMKSGMVLDIASSSFDNGATIWQYPYVGGSNQKWRFANYQTFQIQSVLTGGDIDVQGPTMDLGGVIHEWPAFGFTQQQWIFVPIDNTYFKIVNAYSHRVMDVNGYSVDDFATIHQWDYFGGNNQLWALLSQPNGAYSIINKGSGKALDIAGFSSDPGTTIWQYTFTGASNQQWKLVPTDIP